MILILASLRLQKRLIAKYIAVDYSLNTIDGLLSLRFCIKFEESTFFVSSFILNIIICYE